MKVSCDEGVASHVGPESCGAKRPDRHGSRRLSMDGRRCNARADFLVGPGRQRDDVSGRRADAGYPLLLQDLHDQSHGRKRLFRGGCLHAPEFAERVERIATFRAPKSIWRGPPTTVPTSPSRLTGPTTARAISRRSKSPTRRDELQ